MTEQPMDIPQEQEQQAQPVQGMRFFVKLDDLPSAPTYMQPLSLFRFEATEDAIIMERFDKDGRKWVDSPSMIAFTGLGGEESYKEVSEQEANDLIAQWTPDDAEAEDADAPVEPETDEQEGEAMGGDLGAFISELEEIYAGDPTPENIDRLMNLEIPEAEPREQEGEDHSDILFDFVGEIEAAVEESEGEQAEEEETPADRQRKMEAGMQEEDSAVVDEKSTDRIKRRKEEKEEEDESFSVRGLLKRIFNV